MRIKMLVGLSGLEYSLRPGDERDFPQAEAVRLVAAGYAVPCAESKIERAVAAPIAEKRGPENVVSTDSDGRGKRAHIARKGKGASNRPA